MPDIIQLLPDHVANQIAAGEVVQRPASVVKELLENSIDAGSSIIKLIVKDGGKTLIQVVDDGKGMSVTDARLSFERHATSKIKSAQDLFNLHTKGFRGEALASIAAIAHVDMQTRREEDEVGTQLKIEGSNVVAQEVTVTPKGTSISVKNLFFNIPARRNFLKSDQVELRHITDEFHRVALAHPEIGFSFYNNGSEHFNLKSESFRQRIVHIFGSKINERLVPLEEETEVLKINGFVIKPEFAKKSRGEQFFFVNGRFIKSSYLHHAVVAAFEGLMRAEMRPAYFIKLEVDPATIDINIHPTKTEVKFDDEHTLYALLKSTVKHSLGQFNVTPALDFERDKNLDTPYAFQNKEAIQPNVSVNPSFNPFESHNLGSGNFQKKSVEGWQDLYAVSKKNMDCFSSVQFESETKDHELFESENVAFDNGPSTFQLRRKYIVTKVKSALLVIDQNRAHQRVLYEHYLKSISDENVLSQELLFPIEIKLTAKEFSILEEISDKLSLAGFQIVFRAEHKVVVEAIPPSISEKNIGELLHDFIKEFDEYGTEDQFDIEFTAKSLAKAMAIKNGQILEHESQMALVNDLFGCVEPKLSPFKKLTYITLNENELENNFL
ncbi:DNA mismatch repair endonuclease MutL [Croceivirga thetidis]|uniref:DNA mismatch repair protein MutL n=1 Tax=Croceivirga thetidis TaxID=2721623 RepID=A0ABX1GT51_9FLAO|nr:DNA mismatch repair endonuclease MutL [Croceivirga thetidis]NKI32823.1 DNA mismatch repair endonuclease MutL [Croceivirga thetidis]